MVKKTILKSLAAALALGASAAQAISLNINPSHPNPFVGDAITVILGVSGLGNFTSPLGAYDLDFGFDPGILAFTGLSVGNQLDLGSGSN